MSSGRAAAEDEDMVSLIVGNLTRNATKDSLRRVFEDYGHICDIHIPWKCHYAFVRFINRQDAEEAVQGLNGLRLDGRTIRVELAHCSVRRRGRRSSSPLRRGSHSSRSRSRSKADILSSRRGSTFESQPE